MCKIDKSKYLIATPHEYPGLIAGAYREAKEFSGTKGHIATLSELAKMRLEEKVLDAPPWLFGLTGRNVMYFGLSKNNKLILIITKEKIGPLKSLTGIKEAYCWPDSSCGIITRKQFLELEDEKVEIISLDKYFNEKSSSYRFCFESISQLILDEIIFSLLGVMSRSYILKATEIIKQSTLSNSMSSMASTIQYKIFHKSFVNDLVMKFKTGFFNDRTVAVLPTLTSWGDMRLYGSIISIDQISHMSFVGVKK